MSASDSAHPKDDLLSQIWSVSTTLTEQAMQAASAKALELGFDVNRGSVPLQESFINLMSCRAILEDAIEKRKLIQLPITVQREILVNLQSISKALQGLTSGVDEVVNLTNTVENLNTAIWRFGLHNLSDQVLGYQTKLNQLKNQEIQISKAISDLKNAQKVAEKARESAAEISERKTEATAALEQTSQVATAANASLEQIKDFENKIKAIFSAVQQHEKQSGELAASTKTANNELSSLDASIRKFYSEVEEYRKKINETSEQAAALITTSQNQVKRLVDDGNAKVTDETERLKQDAKKISDEFSEKIEAELVQLNTSATEFRDSSHSEITTFKDKTQLSLATSLEDTQKSTSALLRDTAIEITELKTQMQERASETIEANREKTELLLAELDVLKGQVKEQIQQATSFALFGAFQARQNQVAEAKKIWAYGVAALVLISVCVTAWIAYEAQLYTTHSLAFYVKLSLTVPLAFAITFCALQYSRERRLEEEYAFKASISVSLNPYKDLVQAIIKEDKNAELGKYTEFVIDSVKNVFTSPTDKVFDSEKKSKGISEKAFKQAAEIIGTGVKAAKS